MEQVKEYMEIIRIHMKRSKYENKYGGKNENVWKSMEIQGVDVIEGGCIAQGKKKEKGGTLSQMRAAD